MEIDIPESGRRRGGLHSTQTDQAPTLQILPPHTTISPPLGGDNAQLNTRGSCTTPQGGGAPGQLWDQIEKKYWDSLRMWRENEDQQLAQSYEAQFAELDEEITQIVDRIADIRDEKRKLEQELEANRAELAQARANTDELRREWCTTSREAQPKPTHGEEPSHPDAQPSTETDAPNRPPPPELRPLLEAPSSHGQQDHERASETALATADPSSFATRPESRHDSGADSGTTVIVPPSKKTSHPILDEPLCRGFTPINHTRADNAKAVGEGEDQPVAKDDPPKASARKSLLKAAKKQPLVGHPQTQLSVSWVVDRPASYGPCHGTR
ncbi:hypothetical protein B0T16DRAFT_462643 [Cercophora newfieldiana]|uniref:Uncharacterized protein n=1 Tax=Cercophora newfieldiana TaxID=92897 RepID=A0AA39XSF9_9PEZI|nr:hypothetical protein B0T16DRAFT_462643 [Cercophora newfieldiana]